MSEFYKEIINYRVKRSRVAYGPNGIQYPSGTILTEMQYGDLSEKEQTKCIRLDPEPLVETKELHADSAETKTLDALLGEGYDFDRAQ